MKSKFMLASLFVSTVAFGQSNVVFWAVADKTFEPKDAKDLSKPQEAPSQTNAAPVATELTPVTLKQAISQIKKPETPLDLVRNVQFIYSHGLLRDNDLYTAENLAQVFGGTKEDWTEAANTKWETAIARYRKTACPSAGPCFIDPRINFGEGQKNTSWEITARLNGVQFSFYRGESYGKPEFLFDPKGYRHKHENLTITFDRSSDVPYEKAVGIFLGDDAELIASRASYLGNPRDPRRKEIVRAPEVFFKGGAIADGSLLISPDANLSAITISERHD